MKKIQLGGHRKGSKIKGYALVDDSDYERLNQYKWYVLKNRKKYYVVRNITLKKGKQSIVYMHRLILDTPASMTLE